MFDVIVDVRADSPTRWQWFGVDLSADNGQALFVPAGFAHGFLTTEPKTDVLYQISEFFTPDAGRGIRWDDPAIGFAGPAALVISARGAEYEDIAPATFDLSA